MKLYAIVTSERASKGQGGNEYVRVELKDDSEQVIAVFRAIPDVTNTRLTISIRGKQQYTEYIPKGEKQKGENCIKCGSTLPKGFTHLCEACQLKIKNRL